MVRAEPVRRPCRTCGLGDRTEEGGKEGGWLIAGVSAQHTPGISYLKFGGRATEPFLHRRPGRAGAHIGDA